MQTSSPSFPVLLDAPALTRLRAEHLGLVVVFGENMLAVACQFELQFLLS
jgi:hypothetical protein